MVRTLRYPVFLYLAAVLNTLVDGLIFPDTDELYPVAGTRHPPPEIGPQVSVLKTEQHAYVLPIFSSFLCFTESRRPCGNRPVPGVLTFR